MNAGVVVEGNYFDERAVPVLLDQRLRRQRAGPRWCSATTCSPNSGTCEAGGTVAEPRTYYGYTLATRARCRPRSAPERGRAS